MSKLQGGYDNRSSHRRSVELARKDPVVRFAVERYGAQVVAVHPNTGVAENNTHVRDSEGGKESRVPNKR